ncbi:MAG TPA: hypothetical protein VHA06_17900 [Candidatus Angelobacter sp.]|nr:hypothetical protein [Candidatus Angelobacter sp.]
MSQLQIPQETVTTINRSLRLRATVASEGWGDVVRISQAIVQEALHNIDAYKGTDDHAMAVLTFIWKTVKAHHEKLIATMQDLIKDGDEAALALQKPKPAVEADPDADTAGTSVVPLCDAQFQELETPEE